MTRLLPLLVPLLLAGCGKPTPPPAPVNASQPADPPEVSGTPEDALKAKKKTTR